MSKKVLKESNRLIATRVPPGDRWELNYDNIDFDIQRDTDNVWKIINGLTQVLETYVKATGDKGPFRLEPLVGNLYHIDKHYDEVPVEKDTFDLYGEYE